MSHMSTLGLVTRREDDTDDGCHDCGDSPCHCDALCPTCSRAWRSKAEADYGACNECRCDHAESSYDELGGVA